MTTNQRNPVRWLTVAEAADHLNVKPATLRAWARRGVIPAHRVVGTRQVRFQAAQLDAAMRPLEVLEAGAEGG